MDQAIKKQLGKKARIRRIRFKIEGTAKRPRVSVHKTAKHFSAQVIDDTRGITLASITSSKSKSEGTDVKSASELGKNLGDQLKTAKITEIVLDRRGNKYHGRVAAFADALRKTGVKF